MKKYFVGLLFVLTSSFVPCLKADAQQVIQDKSSLQNCAYYFVFSALFVAFAVWISKKSKWPYFKYFVAYNCAVLLFSTAYHTAVYGKKGCFKAAGDQEYFYFRMPLKPDCYHSNTTNYYYNLDKKSINQHLQIEFNCIKGYQYNNLHYYIFYRFIRDVIFPIKNFYAAFFFSGLLTACIHLIGLFVFVEILVFLKCKSWYKICSCLFLTIEPYFIWRSGIPNVNPFVFSILVFFLWLLIKRKNAILIFLCGYGFYFAHKIYYLLPFVLFVAFFVWHTRKKRILLLSSILTVLLGSGLVLNSSNLSIKNVLVFNLKYRMSMSHGNSQIPQTKYKVLKLCNSWFAPLICNFNKLLVKPKEASKLGFLAAVFFNIVCITCVVLSIYHLIQGKWKHFSEEDKKVIFILLAIIACLTVAFMSVLNYLNLLRHKQCVMSVWYILLAYFYRENTTNNKELESQNA